MMMLSNSRVLVNGTTTTSVAKKNAKVFTTLSSSFSLFFSLLSFVYSAAFIYKKRRVLWIISLSDDTREQYSRVKRERENRAFALSQRPRALLFAPVVSSSLKVSFFVGKIFIIIFVSFIVSLLLSSHPPPQGREGERDQSEKRIFLCAYYLGC